jgi:hypothetical protein
MYGAWRHSSTLSQLEHQTKTSCPRYTLAALRPGKETLVSTGQEVPELIRMVWRRDNFCLCRESNPGLPVVQPVD